MAEEVGIVMTLYDRVSPTLKDLSKNTKAFDKDLDDLEQSLKTFDKNQQGLVSRSAELKKALEGANQRVTDARKEYRKLKDETSKGALDEAIEEQQRLKQALDETNIAIKENNQNYKALLTSARTAAAEASKAENKAEGGMLRQLRTAGLFSLAGDAVSQLGGVLVESALGQPMASFVGSTLSGAASGAAIGSVLGPTGTLLGAAVGGISGALRGGSQVYQAQDEAFKAYYAGLYDTQAQAREEGITSGSATAAQRELDAIAFNRLLGAGVGDQYLASLRTLAADTPLEYSDLTDMSRALAVGFGDSPERMLELMTAIGDAGSAVGLTAADMTEMARALSRMNSSGKATLEYLNILQDRGVNVIQMLADEYGKTQGEIYDMISKGEINGRDAASIIQAGMESAYSGAMDEMASTFSGLTSTLEDTMAEITAGYGTGYNRERSRGMEQEIADYGGSLGDVMARVNELAGENAAYLENLQEQYTREALSAVLLDRDTTLFGEEDRAQLEELRQAFSDAWDLYEETGDRNAALTMQYTQEAAGAIAQAAYEASDQYKMTQDAEADSLEALRSNTSALEASTAAYQLEQERSKGALSGLAEDILSWSSGIEGPEVSDSTRNTYMNALAKRQSREEGSHAAGLGRVPYDNYAALLHEGERVLTASQARELDRGGSGGGVTVNLSGSWTVRSEEDAEELAEILVRKIELAQKAGVIG